jgi:hypothetical protein
MKISPEDRDRGKEPQPPTWQTSHTPFMQAKQKSGEKKVAEKWGTNIDGSAGDLSSNNAHKSSKDPVGPPSSNCPGYQGEGQPNNERFENDQAKHPQEKISLRTPGVNAIEDALGQPLVVMPGMAWIIVAERFGAMDGKPLLDLKLAGFEMPEIILGGSNGGKAKGKGHQKT